MFGEVQYILKCFSYSYVLQWAFISEIPEDISKLSINLILKTKEIPKIRDLSFIW